MQWRTCCHRTLGSSLALLLTGLLAACGADSADPRSSDSQHDYPASKTVDQVDRYHGVAVEDPYRWLEADVRQDETVRAWVDTQQQFADKYLRRYPNGL